MTWTLSTDSPLDESYAPSTESKEMTRSHFEGCSCAECLSGLDSDKQSGGVTFAEDTVPGDINSTATVAVGGYVAVSIDTSGDHDWFRVSLVQGQTYTFYTILGETLADSILTLRDASGVEILSNDDAVLGQVLFSELTFTATSTGTFFLDVSGYDTEVGTGYLTVSSPVADAVAGSSATSAALAIGTAANGSLDATGDHDWYAVTLTAGTTYIFSTSATGGGSDPDTTLVLRNAAGSVLAYNDDNVGTYSQVTFTPSTTATYYVDIAAWGNAEAGAYRVLADLAPPLQEFTYDQIAFQLTNTYWGGASRRWNVAPGGTISVNLTALTVDAQNLAREALNLWSDAIGISFNEVASGGQMTFDDTETGAFASTTRSGGFIIAARVNVETAWITTYGTGLRTYSFQTFVHEIGHALGLGHAGPYNGTAEYPADASYLNDAWATTVMSYFDQAENTFFANQGFTRQFAVTPMLADLIAVQNLYGVNTGTRTGDTTYGFNNTSGRDIFLAAAGQAASSYTIVDNGGTDTLDYSGYASAQRINLNSEAFSNIGGRVGNVSIARGTVIENAIGGSGADTLIGNAAANQLNGGAGVNTLNGLAGNDRLLVAAAGAGTNLDGGADIDTLVVSGAVTPGTIAAMEAIELTSGASLTLTGAQFAAGFALASAVTGTGTITVNLTADTAFLAKPWTVAGGVSFVINGTTGTDLIKLANAANTVTAGDGVDQIKGGNLVDIVNGGAGGDKLNGAGGADVLTGGSGADIFKYADTTDSGLGAARDIITDFAIAEDRLNFGKLDANAALAGDQALSFVGTAAFSNTGIGQVRYGASGSDLVVQVDADGNGVADMEILLQGLAGQTLTGANFVL
jgi:serralysin